MKRLIFSSLTALRGSRSPATVDLLRRAGVEVETVSINKTFAVRGPTA